jgi:hypothetical protein
MPYFHLLYNTQPGIFFPSSEAEQRGSRFLYIGRGRCSDWHTWSNLRYFWTIEGVNGLSHMSLEFRFSLLDLIGSGVVDFAFGLAFPETSGFRKPTPTTSLFLHLKLAPTLKIQLQAGPHTFCLAILHLIFFPIIKWNPPDKIV